MGSLSCLADKEKVLSSVPDKTPPIMRMSEPRLLGFCASAMAGLCSVHKSSITNQVEVASVVYRVTDISPGMPCQVAFLPAWYPTHLLHPQEP